MGERHRCHETILQHVQKAPDDVQREIDQHEFDQMVATKKKDSAPDSDVNPYGVYRCAGGLGSEFLFNAYKRVLEGGAVPASRTVFM